MTTALDLSVPLTVDIAAGPNWLDVVSVPGGGIDLNNSVLTVE